MFIGAFYDGLTQVDSIFSSKVVIFSKKPRKLPRNSATLSFLGGGDKAIKLLHCSILMGALPKEMIYRNFKKFNEKDFKEEICGRLSTELVDNYSSFENVFTDVLNRHASIKKKVIRASEAPYVTKALRKAIMKRSQLEKIYY